MSTNGLGQTARADLMNFVIQAVAFPNTGLVTTYYISLHSADPGENGQTGNEVATGAGTTNYARQSVSANGGWTLGSAASPTYTLSNAATITFPTVGSTAYLSGSPATYFGVWKTVSGTGIVDFIGRGTLQGAGVIVLAGQTASFAIGSLSLTLATTAGPTGMGQAFRKSIYDYLFASTTAGVTNPVSGLTNVFVALHTADPGVDGQTGTEPVGNAYARVLVTRNTSTFGASTVATPSVITNSGAVVTFPQATGSWGTLTYFSLWKTLATTTNTDYILKGTITSIAVTNGNIPSFATSTLTTRLDAT